MALNKNILGNYIELREEINSNLEFGLDDVRGVNNLKFLMQTKADLNGRDLSKFQIVYPREFVFNHRTSRNGSKFSIAYNDGNKPVICTEDYVVFRIKEDCEKVILAEWLYMYFNRSEFDRYVITNSWGSSTEFYNWSDICAVKIELPDLSTQQKYVDIYKAMVANQQSYERGLEDLKLVCDGYIEDLRRNTPCEKIGQYIEKVDERNTEKTLCVSDVKSVNMDGTFAETVANVDEDRIHTYKVVKSNEFAYTNRINIGSIARRLPEDGACLVSASYDVFKVTNKEILLPEYLTLWIRRSEFFRSTGFYAVGSVKDNFSVDMMKLLEIPIPKTNVQQAIVDIYQCYLSRKRINEQLKAQIKNICPILIKGSLEEGKY